ncbi:MAG: carbon-nitrogen hydrolase family protein [Thermoplasmata archaeon]
MSLDEIKIAGMEMSLSSHDEALDLIRHRISPFISKEKPDFVVLPEKWILQRYGENTGPLNDIMDMFCDISGKHDCTIVPGSLGISRNGKLYNSAPVISEGKITGWSDKISLYSIEKNEFIPGDQIEVFNGSGIRFSVAVCYDLDFPYYTKVAIRKGARLLINPSLIREPFHDMWHIYVTGRSLESRIPVISVNSASPPLNGESVGTILEEEEGGVMIRKVRASGSILSYTLDMEKTIPLIEKRMNEDPGIYSIGNK